MTPILAQMIPSDHATPSKWGAIHTGDWAGWEIQEYPLPETFGTGWSVRCPHSHQAVTVLDHYAIVSATDAEHLAIVTRNQMIFQARHNCFMLHGEHQRITKLIEDAWGSLQSTKGFTLDSMSPRIDLSTCTVTGLDWIITRETLTEPGGFSVLTIRWPQDTIYGVLRSMVAALEWMVAPKGLHNSMKAMFREIDDAENAKKIVNLITNPTGAKGPFFDIFKDKIAPIVPLKPSGPSASITDLYKLFPAIKTAVSGDMQPSVDHFFICGPIDLRTVKDWIIHLNDRHEWTREKIADWLDTLQKDHGLTFRIPSTNQGD